MDCAPPQQLFSPGAAVLYSAGVVTGGIDSQLIDGRDLSQPTYFKKPPYRNITPIREYCYYFINKRASRIV